MFMGYVVFQTLINHPMYGAKHVGVPACLLFYKERGFHQSISEQKMCFLAVFISGNKKNYASSIR